jgi:hypothetical protein
VGLPIPGTLVVAARELASRRFDFDCSLVDYVARADELNDQTLVVIGSDDTKVYPEPIRELATARPDKVAVVEFPGAGHVRAWNIDTPRYTRAVGTFLRANAP